MISPLSGPPALRPLSSLSLFAILRSRQRMMFVHDAPPAVNFAQSHGQPKFERLTFAVRITVYAPPYCRSEGNILATSDLHIVKSEGNRLFNRREKLLPRRHVV